jgi:hypothetical protein
VHFKHHTNRRESLDEGTAPQRRERRSHKPVRGKCLLAVLACAVGALAVVGSAAAANSASFTDPSGDAELTPDITRIDVSNDDGGTITFRITYGESLTLGLPGEEFGVALDLDQNPDTGSVDYGTEVALAFEGSTLTFMRANGAGLFDKATPPASLRGSIGDTTASATFSVKATDLGLAPNAGFNLVGISHSYVTSETDTAPDIRSYNYQLIAGTPPRTPGPDTRAPLDKAIVSHGVHGKVAQLDYLAEDGRGVTADTLWVYRRRRLLKTIHVSLGDVNPFFVYYQPWRVPRSLRGRLRFCVRSVDAGGNKSNLSCAALVVR